MGLEIHHSLEKVSDVEVWGCTSVPDHSRFVYDKLVQVEETVSHPNFVRRLEEVVRDNGIDCVLPANDLVCAKLAGTHLPVVGSSKEACDLVVSKLDLYEHFCGVVNVPEVYSKIKSYPVFLKPNCGSGAKDCRVVNSKRELDFYLNEHLVMEYLPGDEYTVDCFTDWKGVLRYVGPRTRERMACGLAVSTTTFKSDRMETIARKINSSVGFNGAWFFQLKKNVNHELTLTDLGCRIAGSSVASRMKGVNLSHLNILNFKKMDFEISEKGEVEVSRSWGFSCKPI